MEKKKAVLCANLSSLVYKDFDDKLSARLKKIAPNLLYFDKNGTQAFLLYSKTECFVVFRGTQPTQMADVSADLKTWPKRSDEVQGLVHSGFAGALDCIWDDLEGVIDIAYNKHKFENIYFTGHSLGGALAVVAAARSKYVGEVYTYGQPRVGNRLYAKQVKSKVHRFVNNNDVVPRIPPPLIFGHQGTKYHIIDENVIQPKNLWQATMLSLKARFKRILKFKYFRSLVADHDITAYYKLLKSAKF